MSDPAPWTPEDGGSDVRRHAPATLRNREAIAQVLETELPVVGTVLEIASGSGEHCAWFARLFPGHRWIPSDPEADARASIAAWCEGVDNVAEPLAIDATAVDWPVDHADAILCINMVHISPWTATEGLIRHAARLLPRRAPLILYGPYIRDGVETAPSNLAFDQSLRARDPAWGLRRVEDVAALATAAGLSLTRLAEMPANNLTLVFRRD